MKTLFRCVQCHHYGLQKQNCPKCDAGMLNPYPARFSLEKEKKYRKFVKKIE
ncbi:MAG: nucleolar RNA-binding Nop10p family protein [Candidatus Heimdallarchaeota archaeon]